MQHHLRDDDILDPIESPSPSCHVTSQIKLTRRY